MKPLSKEASAALSALQATDPTRADEARVRRNLERALGVVVPAASIAAVTTAASAQAATGASMSGGMSVMGLGAKAVAFVMAVGVGVAVTVTTVTAVKTTPAIEITIDAPHVPRAQSRVVNPEPLQPEELTGPAQSRRGVIAEPEPVVEIAASVVQPRLRAPPPPTPPIQGAEASAPEHELLPPPPSPPLNPRPPRPPTSSRSKRTLPTAT